MLDTIRLTDELNTHIMKLEAKDLDSGRNGELLFNLLEDEMGIFDVISDTGDLVLAKITNVDKPEWIITVSVQDNGAYRILSSTRQIRVVNERKKKITKNLESPMFLKQKYIGHVNENIRGEFVMQLGNNDFSSFGKSDAPISFSIIGGNKDSAFEIDNAGRIKTTKELDAEIEDNYSLNIIALNEYSRSSSTICHIKVLNLNDNLPFFAVQRPKKISESILIGTQIAVVNANDADGDLIYYSINPASEYFEVEKFTGAIFLKQSLDYETIKEHELGIQAYDGEHVATTFLKIIVIDENDNKPTFIGGSFQQINIADNSPPNANIHTVIAKDNDDSFNGQITYALINSPSDYFSLNSTSGVIKLLKKPIVEGTHHIMMISASDKGVIPQTSILTLKVQSISGSEMRIPQFRESSIKFAILEDHPVYETFGKLELKENYRMPLEFVIKDIDAAKIFHINNEGYISLKRKVDRETKSSYLFNVYLSQYNDNRGETCSVSLNVIDVNDNFPVLLANSTKKIYLNENLSKDTILGKIYAVDLDFQRNGAIGYSILSGNDFNMVSINSENGVIKFEKWDDQIIYQKNLQDLVILVKDHGTPQKMNVIVVSVVIDIKTWSGMAPFFVMPTFVFYVSEDTLANTVIASTQAVSRFGIHGDDWTYSLTNNPSNFGVNIATGYLILKEPLDYEKKTSYDFQIIVQDAKERKAISRIVIEVISVDEFAPAFTKPSYTFKLSTSADVGFVIGSVKAVDNDSGSHGKVTYSIHGSNVKMIGIDPTSGVLMLRESMTNKIIKANKTLEHLIVEAASSATQSSRANIYLEIGHFDLPPSDSLLVEDFSYIIIISAVCFVILAVICTLGCMRLCKDSPNNTKRVQNLYETQKRMPDISNISAGFDSPKYIKSNVPLPPIPFNTASSNSSQDFSMYDKNGDSTVAFRLSRHENNRSHPDSGIDQDNLSINTTVTEYLSQIGVTPLNKYFDSSLKKPLPKHDSSDFNDFMYTKVDEILGSSSNYQIKGPPILSSYTTQIPRSSTYFRNEDLNASPQFRSIISILGRK
uniref:CA domain-containing protein n=1 Tax=Rhabditophanes sp. KR3021 TaxID=114890 RepID=A0AC35UE47_9BILA